MRVCAVVNNLDVGGLEKVVLHLLRHLPPEVETSLVCLSGPGKLFGEVPLPPERCLVLDKPPVLTWSGRLRIPGQLARLAWFLRRRRVDVLHAHNLGPLVLGGAAARLLGPLRPRVVYSEHNQVYSADARTLRRFPRYLRLADAIVAVSGDLRGTLERHEAPRPIRVIHNGIDVARFAAVDGAALRGELGVSPGDFLFGTTVVLSEQKGLGYLLEAALRVRAADPTVRFVIAGDGPSRRALEQRAASLGLGDTVRFLGYRSDVPRVLSTVDAYVLPSLWEGLPLALLEAMACGKPIVATRVGGNPEVVSDGENGFLVPPRDPEALAGALLRLRADPACRERMARANVAKARERFSVEAMTRAHVELYREWARA